MTYLQDLKNRGLIQFSPSRRSEGQGQARGHAPVFSSLDYTWGVKEKCLLGAVDRLEALEQTTFAGHFANDKAMSRYLESA